MIKNLHLVDRHEKFKEAKKQVSSLRNDKAVDDLALYKIIFSENELEAEQKLQEKREEQIVREWEK